MVTRDLGQAGKEVVVARHTHTYTHTMGDPFGDGNVLCLSHISVITLAVILYYGFAQCHWDKLGKGPQNFSIMFPATACKSTIISK